MVDDPRYRIKVFLDTYLTAANMLKPDGVTPLAFHVMYDAPDISYIWLFNGLSNDMLFTIGTPVTAADAIDWDATGIGYTHKVPITIATASSETVNGDKAIWQGNAELRRVIETYPIGTGSFRLINQIVGDPEPMGAWTLHKIKYTLLYQVDTT